MGRQRLTSEYVAGKTARIQGMGQHGWWFTGGTSFMSNGYVIYKKGLEGYPPNPIALGQAGTYQNRMFNYRSMDKRSSYYQFITQLQTIAERAAANEERYLEIKLQELKKTPIDVDYLDLIESRIKAKDYNAAYTLLMRRSKDLAAFKAEIQNHNQSFSRTNEFFSTQFFTYLEKKFLAQLENQSGINRVVRLEDNFDVIVDDFFSQAFGDEALDNTALDALKDQFVRDLETIAKNSGGHIMMGTQLQKNSSGETLVYLAKENAKRTGKSQGQTVLKNIRAARKDIVTETGEYRSAGQLAKAFALTLSRYIGNGLSAEVYGIVSGQRLGAAAISTGTFQKEISNYWTNKKGFVQQKDDIRLYEVYGASIDTKELIAQTYRDTYEQGEQAFLSELSRRMKNMAAVYEGAEFFEIAENVKGYRSMRDLAIAGEGKFSSRLSTLKGIDLGGNMTDKLIFMLNNTTKGCIAEDNIDALEDYFAAVCVAWMWDNSEDIFDLKLDAPKNYRKIYFKIKRL